MSGIDLVHDFHHNEPALHAAEAMNRLGAAREPFLFVLDYAVRRPLVIPLAECNPNEVRYAMPLGSNDAAASTTKDRAQVLQTPRPSIQIVEPPSRERYRIAFDRVQEHLRRGNSYLVNLTLPTRITVRGTLLYLFQHSHARYRLWLRDQFVVFSPEPFLSIRGNIVSSCPMKGTRVGTGPAVEQALLADEKEHAEHITIVDLIRNDIGRIARSVRVERFRYLETIHADTHALQQMSSRIEGVLDADWQCHIGSLLLATLPAGSVTGAPKTMTCRIIDEVEQYDRGYYTGIAGIFDGEGLDSGVLIRFVEQDTAGGFWFKSGGGITVYSDGDREYDELLAKVYVPLLRNDPR